MAGYKAKVRVKMLTELKDFKESLEKYGERMETEWVYSYFVFENDFDKVPNIRNEEKIPYLLRDLGVDSVIKVGRYVFGNNEYSLREILSSGEIREKSVEAFMERPCILRIVFEQALRERPEWARRLGIFPSHSIYQ